MKPVCMYAYISMCICIASHYSLFHSFHNQCSAWLGVESVSLSGSCSTYPRIKASEKLEWHWATSCGWNTAYYNFQGSTAVLCTMLRCTTLRCTTLRCTIRHYGYSIYQLLHFRQIQWVRRHRCWDWRTIITSWRRRHNTLTSRSR